MHSKFNPYRNSAMKITMEPLVSIIIPTYQAAATVRETLDSVCRQTWTAIEVILVDDGSSDNTADVAEAYPDSRIIVIRSEHVGACSARNIGIRKAKGAYLQFLDGDDTLDSRKIELQIKALSGRNPGQAVAYGPWWEFSDKCPSPIFGFRAGRHFSEPMEWLFSSMLEGFFVPPHCWLVPSSVVDAAGEWDVRLSQNQDGEFFARVLEQASEVVWVLDAISYYRGGNPSSISKVKGRPYTKSLLLAANLIRDRMLDYAPADSSRRKIVSALYLRILYRIDPSDQEMVELVWSEIRKLGLPPRSLSLGGARFNLIKAILGWRLAFKAKSLIAR